MIRGEDRQHRNKGESLPFYLCANKMSERRKKEKGWKKERDGEQEKITGPQGNRIIDRHIKEMRRDGYDDKVLWEREEGRIREQ